MRRVISIAVAGASLAGCSSFPSVSMDYFKSTPPTIQVQLDSQPQGADAKTSLGPGCKTPCSVAITPPEAGFSVTYTLNKFEPATVPVQVFRSPGDLTTPSTTTFDPNPVVAELQPAGPPPKPPRKHIVAPKKPKPPQGTAAAPAPPAGSAFPDPNAPPPPKR
jgi:hypothetical protein